MDLRFRVALTLAVITLSTILVAWVMVAGGVLRPLIGELNSERMDIAVYVAKEVEQAEDPRARVKELTKELHIEVGVGPRPPPPMGRRARSVQRDGHEVLFLPGPKGPMAVSFTANGHELWMLIHFPADLERAPRRVGMGLLLLALASLGLGLLVVRQVFRPLNQTTAAMRRIADGDLDHRLGTTGGVPEAERTFNRMADRVQELVQGQRDLMAAVSHELRTPLSRMRLQLVMLRDESGDHGRLDALEADVAEVDALVEELLESARMHQGQLALDCTEVDAMDLATEALGAVDLGDREVRLDVEPGLVLHVDRRRVLRCLRNLLSNVVRYTPHDTDVRLRMVARGAEVEVSVADRGPGVARADIDQLFAPFYRAESSRSRKTGGLGLGLMLVRQIADAHGGRAVARIREGGGLEVALFLPVGADVV